MKRIVSLLLSVIMIVSSLIVGSFAVPSQQCLRLDADGFRSKMTNFTTAARNTVISFDISMEEDDYGLPMCIFNGGGKTGFVISDEYVEVAGVETAINWGAVELTHWRHVEVVYNNGNVMLYIDGADYGTAAGTCVTSYFDMVCEAGTILIDNLIITSSGTDVVNIVFEDEGAYLNHKDSSVSTAARYAVPTGSYVLPNQEYIFENPINSDRFSVEGEKFIAGDLDANGKINSKDLSAFKNYLAGYSEDYDVKRVDIDGSGKINAVDLSFLCKVTAGFADERYVDFSYSTAEYNAAGKSALLTVEIPKAGGNKASIKLDNISASDYSWAVITYMTPNNADDVNSDVATTYAVGVGGEAAQFTIVGDGYFHYNVVDMSAFSAWDGTGVDLCFFTEAETGDRMYIDSIIFCVDEYMAGRLGEARLAAKSKIYIAPSPENTFGYEDSVGSYVVRFDTENAVNSYVTNYKNTAVEFAADEDGKGSMKLTATSAVDPGAYIDLTSCGISADEYKYITYIYKHPTTNNLLSPQGNIYYVCNTLSAPNNNFVTDTFSLNRDGMYNAVTADLSAKANYRGAMKAVRLDYFVRGSVDDCAYVDSIIFSKDSGIAATSANMRLADRAGNTIALSTAEVWNTYWQCGQALNADEYIYGEPTDLTMYFRYASFDKLTGRSLADRMSRAVSEATGYDVECEIYSGMVDLKNDWSSDMPTAEIYYTLTYNGESYVVWLNTKIIKDSDYSDILDGTSADPEDKYEDTSTWFSEGINVTDSVALPVSHSGLSAHSNNENRIVKTPYGTFAAIPMENNSTWAVIGGAKFTLYQIFDDGSTKALGTYDFANHTSKPSIYWVNGRVFVVSADDQGSYASILVLHFDPSSPKADGTYTISSSRTNRSYYGGAAPGGYGYIQPMLDDTTGKIHVMACGGSTTGYFAWTTYDTVSKTWSGSYSTSLLETNRHCYLYGYPDGKGGMYVVGGRDVLLSSLGLDSIITGANYAWDEVNIFHFPSMTSTDYTFIQVHEADYTQKARELFPVTSNNSKGDTYMTEDGYLHIISSTNMHGTFHHDSKSWEMWHHVYDCTTPGMTPVEIYSKPISFAGDTNVYSARMVESTDGSLYILAMPANLGARCEVWRATDESGFEFELVGCRNFTGKSITTAMVVANNRNGSVIDNKISVMYPTDNNGGTEYRYFTVDIK